MLMKILILLVMIVWLVASLPQTRFIWVPTIYEQGSFDWIAANLRAVIIDFLPLAVVFVESQLLSRHTDKARRSFGRRKDKDELDFDVWQETYSTTEKGVAKQMPRLFVMSTIVISVSYWAYYTEFGRDMALYHVEPLGLKIGGLIEFLVLVVYLTISALFTYGWGKLMSAFEVHTVLEDLGKAMSKTLNSFRKPQPKTKKVSIEVRPKPRVSIRVVARKRRDTIHKLLLENANQDIVNLSKRFEVSTQTIRNDYKALEIEGKILYKKGKVIVKEEAAGDF